MKHARRIGEGTTRRRPARRNRKHWPTAVLWALCCLLTVAGCNRRPDYVLDDKQMARVLIDVHRAEALLEVQGEQFRTDDQKRDVMGAVLVKNGVSRAQYDSSLVWYGQHLKRLINIYNRVADSLDNDQRYWQRVMEDSQDFGVSDSGDSVNVWRSEPYLVMDASRLTHFRSWQIPADTAFHAGDSLSWYLHLSQLGAHHYAVATLAIGFAPDSVAARTAVLRCDTSLCLGMAPDSLQAYERVLLTLSVMKDSVAAPDVPAVVDSISLIRFHR